MDDDSGESTVEDEVAGVGRDESDWEWLVRGYNTAAYNPQVAEAASEQCFLVANKALSLDISQLKMDINVVSDINMVSDKHNSLAEPQLNKLLHQTAKLILSKLPL